MNPLSGSRVRLSSDRRIGGLPGPEPVRCKRIAAYLSSKASPASKDWGKRSGNKIRRKKGFFKIFPANGQKKRKVSPGLGGRRAHLVSHNEGEATQDNITRRKEKIGGPLLTNLLENLSSYWPAKKKRAMTGARQ